MPPSLINRLRAWVEVQISAFDAEAEIRIQDRDLEKLRPLSLKIIIAFAAAGALIFAFNLAAPPGDPVERLEKFSHKYIQKGQVCISGDRHLDCKEVGFPLRDTDRLSPKTQLPVEYYFDVTLGPEDQSRGLSSLLMPLIWGESEIYRNGILMNRGPNIFDSLVLLPGMNRIRVVVSSDSGQKLGIRALFPPTVLSAANAQSFRDDVVREPATWRLTLALQLMVIAILAMFWIWSESQPELLLFLILAFVEALKNIFGQIINDGQFFFSGATDPKIYEVLGSLAIFLTVPFILVTFRVPLRNISDMPRKYGWKYLGIVAFVSISTLSLFSSMPLPSGRTLGFIVASTAFLIWISVKRLVPLLVKRLYSRFLLTTLTVAGVLVWYSRLVIDLSNLTMKITTEYNNQLLFFVVMAGLLAFQFGKTESRLSKVKSLSSREVVHKVERPNAKTERRGFVVLVDIVGWTSKRRRIQTETKRNEYSQKTLEALFSTFDSRDFSVPQQHGDSVFFTRTCDPTKDFFLDVVGRCKSLCLSRPTMRELGITAQEIADQPFIARATIYYGAYDIIIASSEFHNKEAFTGDAPETCARIIGNNKDPRTVRVVAGTELDAFRPQNAPILAAEGKSSPDEPQWLYWET